MPIVTPEFIYQPVKGGPSDYRPVVDSSGTTVLFERSKNGGTTIYITPPTINNTVPAQQFPGTNASSRVDWQWQTGKIAFNTGPENVPTGIRVVDDVSGTNPIDIPGVPPDVDYPVWFPGTTPALAVENLAAQKCGPVPRNSTLWQKEGAWVWGPILSGTQYCGGMPSIKPNGTSYVFAGQIFTCGTPYNQNTNVILIADDINDPSTIRALEGDIDQKDPCYQGRAPWWSPDGQHVVFESYRANAPNPPTDNAPFALYVYQVDGNGGPAQRVTPPGYNVNHAKFFSNGTDLVAASQGFNTPLTSNWGIALVPGVL